MAVGSGVELATGYVNIVASTKGLGRQITGDFSTYGDQASKSFTSKWASGLSGMIKTGAKTGAAVGAAIAGAAAVTGFQRLMGLEEAEKRLESMGLSGGESAKLMDALNDTLTGTPYALDKGATAMAGFVSAGVDLDKIPGILDSVTDAAAFGQADLGEVSDIFQKVALNGGATTEMLNQLQYRGIPATALLADSLNMTGEEFSKFVTEGGLDADTFFTAWEDGAEGFGDNNIQMAGAAQDAGDTVRGAFGNMKTALGRAGAAALGPIFERLPDLFAAITEKLKDVTENIGPMIERFLESERLADIIGTVRGALERVPGILRSVHDALRPFVEAIGRFVLSNPAPVFAALAVVVGTLLVGALWGMAAAFIAALSPVYLAIAAVALLAGGLVWAYKNVEWFRDSVDRVAAFLTAVLVPAFNVWWRVAQFVFKAVVAYVNAWWVVSKTVFTWVAGFITGTLIPTAQTLWAVARVVFAGISAAIQWAWTYVIQPVFSALSGFVTGVLVPVFSAYLGVMQFVWSLVRAAITDAWNIIQPVFSAIVGFVRDQLVVRFEAFMGVAQTVWGAVHGAVSAAWGIIAPIFLKIVDFVNTHLVPVWEKVSTAVSDAFGRIPGFIRGALRTAGGIVAGFMRGVASIAGAIGLTDIKNALNDGADSASRWGHDGNAAANRSADARRRMATGGYISGGTPGKDSVPALLMPGEVVIRKSMVDKYGAANLLALNAGKVPGFAAGGMVGKDELVNLARAVGVVRNANTAAAIAMAESGGNPNAFNRNRNGTVDRGLWQINSIHGALSTFDIQGNARAMASISGGGSNWSPWVVYNTGAYRQFLDGDGLFGNLETRDLISDAVRKAREIAGGLLERTWPKMDVANGLLGLPAGGLNYARQAIIDLIKGRAAEVEGASGDGSQRGGGLPGSTTGLDPEFLRRFQAWNGSLGGKYGIYSGFRSRAAQAVLYQKYLNGTGNLAAPPGRSPHERGLAIDTTPRVTAADQAAARAFRLHFPVRGEPWHVEPFAKGGFVHANNWDSGGSLRPGWNVVRNDTGADEPLVPAGRQAPLVSVGEQHFHDGADVDLFWQSAGWAAREGRA